MSHPHLSRGLVRVVLSISIADLFALTACGGSSAAGVNPAAEASGFDRRLDPELARLAALAGAARMPSPAPEDPNRVALGRALFFDRILSGNRNISCYTCHDVDFGTGDALSVSIGTGGFGKGSDRELADGVLIPRNAPPLFRLAGRTALFADSRVSRGSDGALTTPEPALNGLAPAAPEIVAALPTAVAAQAMFPVTNREEMRGQPGENEIADAADNLQVWALLMRRLVGTDDGSASGIPAYRSLFATAYPDVHGWDEFNFGHAAQAISAFEISAFHTDGSAFDAWLAGNAAALSDKAKQGGILFYGRANCAACHGGAEFSDGLHHAVGVPQVGPGKDFPFEDTGRALVTGNFADRYAFRTPTLRNVELTGPWMHDGAYTTLEAAVRHFADPVSALSHYDASQLAPLLQPLVDADPIRQAARAAAISSIVRSGVHLDNDDVDRLVAFLESLTDEGARDVTAAEPATVPSGLPIDDE